ncbi:hypothetical protein VUR80DRAFT_8705 [Thermomyces stellatus]
MLRVHIVTYGKDRDETYTRYRDFPRGQMKWRARGVRRLCPARIGPQGMIHVRLLADLEVPCRLCRWSRLSWNLSQPPNGTGRRSDLIRLSHNLAVVATEL